MSPFRTALPRRLAVVLIAFVATTVMTRASSANLLVLASPGRALHVHTTATPALHTSAGALDVRRHPAHRRLRHHAHRHGAHLARLTRHIGHRGDGLPARPAPRRTERRAALPHVVRTHRADPGPRHGGRHVAALASALRAAALAAGPLDPARTSTSFACEHPMISGRGPPRAGPPSHSPAFAAAPAVPFRAAHAPAHTPPDVVSFRPPRTVPCAARGPRWLFPVDSERQRCRSLAHRPEGAVAGFMSPSVGELS
jgi:hypothetical protein